MQVPRAARLGSSLPLPPLVPVSPTGGGGWAPTAPGTTAPTTRMSRRCSPADLFATDKSRHNKEVRR